MFFYLEISSSAAEFSLIIDLDECGSAYIRNFHLMQYPYFDDVTGPLLIEVIAFTVQASKL